MADIKAPEGYTTIQAYAEWHGVSINTVNYWLHAGAIPYIKVGERRFIEKSNHVPKELKQKRIKCPHCKNLFIAKGSKRDT